MRILSGPHPLAGCLLILLFLALAGSSTAQIASWNNATLNFNGAVSASIGTGTLSRGAGINYQNAANVYSSTGWPFGETTATDYIQIAVDTTGRTDIVVRYTDIRNANGPLQARIYYSSTGPAGPFTTIHAAYGPALTATNQLFDFSGVAALHNNPNVVFRVTGWLALSGASHLRFSNIVIGDSPSVVDVFAQDERSIGITFSKDMGASATVAANYTATGAGLGTLTAQPDSVMTLSPATYLLQWNAPKEMRNGMPVTVTVTGPVFSSTGFPMAPPTSDTTTGIGIAPLLSSITVFGPDPTNAANVDFLVTWDEGVMGDQQISPFNNFGVTLVGGSLAGLAVTSVSGTGAARDVSITAGAGDGTVRLDLTSAGTIADLAGNPFTGTFTTGSTVRIDHIAPTVVSITPQSGSVIDLTFSEDVDAFALTGGNYIVSGPGQGTLGASPASSVSLGGSAYQLTWGAGSSINGQMITVTASNAIADLATNPIVPGSGDSASAIALPVELSTFMLE